MPGETRARVPVKERTRPPEGSGPGRHTVVSLSSLPHAAKCGIGDGAGGVWYPAAKGRGQFSPEEALARWPLAGRVYAELERTGPASAARLAKRLDVGGGHVEAVLWWLTFADDNGAVQMVHGHVFDWRGRGRRTSVRFVHREDLAHGCGVTDAVACRWYAHPDRQAAGR